MSSSSGVPTPSPELLKSQLAYSLVWSMGGHLSPANKLVFDQWWRDTFIDPGLALPHTGLVWDHHPSQEQPGFLPCSADMISSPDCDSRSPLPPFVATARASAFAHLVHQLIKQGSSVLVVGNPGSGKTALLRQTFCENIKDISFQHFYASQVMHDSDLLFYFMHVHVQYVYYLYIHYHFIRGLKVYTCMYYSLNSSHQVGHFGRV